MTELEGLACNSVIEFVTMLHFVSKTPCYSIEQSCCILLILILGHLNFAVINFLIQIIYLSE